MNKKIMGLENEAKALFAVETFIKTVKQTPKIPVICSGKTSKSHQIITQEKIAKSFFASSELKFNGEAKIIKNSAGPKNKVKYFFI